MLLSMFQYLIILNDSAQILVRKEFVDECFDSHHPGNDAAVTWLHAHQKDEGPKQVGTDQLKFDMGRH